MMLSVKPFAGRILAAWVASLIVLLSVAPIKAQEIDEVVLIVNDIAVTAHEYNVLHFIQTQSQRFGEAKPDLDDPVTQAIVDELLLAAHARKVAPGVKISDEQLNQALDALAARNKLSRDQLLNQLRAQGVDIDIFRSALRKRLLTQEVLAKRIAATIVVSPAEVEEYIANRPELSSQVQKIYRLSHLVIPVGDNLSRQEKKALRKLAETVGERLRSGESFADVADEFKEVSASGSKGDIGWKKAEELPDLFIQALKTMKPGDVSPMLESSNGFHFLGLSDVKTAGGQQLEYRVRHILRSLPPQADASKAAAELKNMKLQILAGLDFGEMARSRSDDKGSAPGGGDIGWITLNQVDPNFAKAVQVLQPGEISDPVRSQFGLHLIQVLDTRSAQGGSDLEQQVQQLIFSEKLQEKMQDLLNDLRQVALIEVVN